MSGNKPTVLITGAGSGIGAATARLFSEHGHKVILTGRRTEKLEKTASTLKTKAIILPADLRQDQEIQWLAHEALKEAPDLGILVNNAGIFERRSFMESDDELWKKMYEVHFMAIVRLCRYLVPHFEKEKRGVILNVASTAGMRPLPQAIAYTSMKAAVISLTQNLALDLAKNHIRVNCICPGVVETPIHKVDEVSPEALAELRKQWAEIHPLGRAGNVDDVARGIYWLCDPVNDWVTGAVLPVDGGISLL